MAGGCSFAKWDRNMAEVCPWRGMTRMRWSRWSQEEKEPGTAHFQRTTSLKPPRRWTEKHKWGDCIKGRGPQEQNSNSEEQTVWEGESRVLVDALPGRRCSWQDSELAALLTVCSAAGTGTPPLNCAHHWGNRTLSLKHTHHQPLTAARMVSRRMDLQLLFSLLELYPGEVHSIRCSWGSASEAWGAERCT